MRVFTRIVELGGFAKAADSLQLPRASVTIMIKQLEAHLGVQLLQRTTRQVNPTPDGAAYYQRCVQLLTDLEETEAVFSNRRQNPRGTLSIDMPSGIGRLIVIPALPTFTACYPQIELEIGLNDRPVDLILQECQRTPAPSSALLERLCHLLFLYVLRQQVLDNTALGGLAALGRQPAFAHLLEQLIARPAEAWTLESMAACTGLSRSAFFKRFNELCGRSPGQVLLMMRMRHACQLFKQDQTVAEVALAVGYQSVAAFTRAFHKVTGQQPGAYRKAQA
jgi:AraC-like DNA-binding protein